MLLVRHTRMKLLIDRRSLFSIVSNFDKSASKININVIGIENLESEWKICFNEDKAKTSFVL